MSSAKICTSELPSIKAPKVSVKILVKTAVMLVTVRFVIIKTLLVAILVKIVNVGPIILAVFSEGTDPGSARGVISQIARALYDAVQ